MEEETSGPLPPENTKTADDTGNDNAQPMETDEDGDNGMSEPMVDEASTPPLDGATNYAQERGKEGTDEAASNDMPPPMAGRTSEPIVAGISENAGVTENTETILKQQTTPNRRRWEKRRNTQRVLKLPLTPCHLHCQKEGRNRPWPVMTRTPKGLKIQRVIILSP